MNIFNLINILKQYFLLSENMMNYFELFNIPQKIIIDQKILSKQFYKLQRKFHPDQFIELESCKTEEKLQKSILINKAYYVLKNFFLRAKYILSLNGFDLSNKNYLINDANFLIKQFNFSEKLQNIHTKSDNLTEIKQIKLYVKNCIKNYKNQIIIALNNQQWKIAITILQKLSFFRKKYILIKNIEIEYKCIKI